MTSKRATWETRVGREPFSEQEETADALSWARISLGDRATWELSKELYLLLARNAAEAVMEAELERRVPRTAFHIARALTRAS
jgi:hypothetical protein